jgi:protein-tyrosine sulfotransferase
MNELLTTGDDTGGTAWPIFILSSHRSGSTLLRYLLDAHPHLACPPESKFIGGLEKFIEYPQIVEALATLGLSSRDLAKELRLFIERIMGQYTRRVNKRRWIDKTPNYYRLTYLIDQIFEGQVQYIVLVRHPLDCICSLESFFVPYAREDDPDITRNLRRHGVGRCAWAHYWIDIYTRLSILAAMYPERTRVERYEDLVQSPHDVLKRVVEFIGESYVPDLVDRALVTPHDEGFGDHKIGHTTTIHQRSVGKWTAWPRSSIDAIWDLVGPLAVKFGYTATS